MCTIALQITKKVQLVKRQCALIFKTLVCSVLEDKRTCPLELIRNCKVLLQGQDNKHRQEYIVDRAGYSR